MSNPPDDPIIRITITTNNIIADIEIPAIARPFPLLLFLFMSLSANIPKIIERIGTIKGKIKIYKILMK